MNSAKRISNELAIGSDFLGAQSDGFPELAQ
jgi:hypothetical protein